GVGGCGSTIALFRARYRDRSRRRRSEGLTGCPSSGSIHQALCAKRRIGRAYVSVSGLRERPPARLASPSSNAPSSMRRRAVAAEEHARQAEAHLRSARDQYAALVASRGVSQTPAPKWAEDRLGDDNARRLYGRREPNAT